MTADNYVRRFTVSRIVDGDTLWVVADLAYHTSRAVEYRILGCDCPESNRAATKTAGLAAKAYTVAWLTEHAAHDPGGWLYARTETTDSFGRYLARVTCADGDDLTDALLASGNAVPYPLPKKD